MALREADALHAWNAELHYNPLHFMCASQSHVNASWTKDVFVKINQSRHYRSLDKNRLAECRRRTSMTHVLSSLDAALFAGCGLGTGLTIDDYLLFLFQTFANSTFSRTPSPSLLPRPSLAKESATLSRTAFSSLVSVTSVSSPCNVLALLAVSSSSASRRFVAYDDGLDEGVD